MTQDSSPAPSSQAPLEAPHDKKRIALLNGACGQANRIRICGQVVDIPVTRNQKTDRWDNLHNLPAASRERIRPIEDFTMLGVRRPRLQIEILDLAPASLPNPTIVGESADTDAEALLNDAKVLYRSPIIIAGEDGFFAHELRFGEDGLNSAAEATARASRGPAPREESTADRDVICDAEIQPGRYVLRAMLRGIDSIRQSVADLAYIGSSDSLILKNDVGVGYGRLCILPEDYSGPVLTSDIDQTFLDTPLHSTQGLMETLFENPGEKRPIFALPEFYRQMQAREIPLLFISASPHFFRRTLSAVFEHHRIEITGLHLKYLVGTFDNIVKKFAETMLNLNDFLGQGVGASVERTLKFLGSSVMSLFDHVSYKLITLLENRLMQPTGAREILMGDNKESDFFIFSLYQTLIAGAIPLEGLEEYLYRLNFSDREALTRDAARRIVALTRANRERHGELNSVDAVWINLSRDEPDDAAMLKLVREALPKQGAAYLDNAHFRAPQSARGGAGFGLLACAEGQLTEEALVSVLKSGVGGPYQSAEITLERTIAMTAEFGETAAASGFAVGGVIAELENGS